VDEDKIREVVEKGIFSKSVAVAFGKEPKRGEDAKVILKIVEKKRDEEGRVNFREMGKIKTVRAGEVVAEKVPATKGEEGYNVRGESILAEDGKDVTLLGGKNTQLSEDGLCLISKIDGLLIQKGDVIDVEPVFFVDGDVDFGVGNIDFAGKVEVKGNVKEGFKVKAFAVHVCGYIEGACINAKSDVVIEQGVIGKGKARIETEGNFRARFVESSQIYARNIFVREAILHSDVAAREKVILSGGKRGTIIGGRIRAGSEVNCKRLGSVAEIETIVEVGTDPALLEELADLQREQRADEVRVQELLKSIKSAEAEGKKDILKQLEAAKEMLVDKMRTMNLRISKLKSQIQESRRGKVCVFDKLYRGVTLCIGDAKLEVMKEYRFVTFRAVEGALKPTSYEEPPSFTT
jgi:hypothetical protein